MHVYRKGEKYETRCAFCNKKTITEKGTANEGICYMCRCA